MGLRAPGTRSGALPAAPAPDQRLALLLGAPAPDAVLDALIQRVPQTFGLDIAAIADRGRLLDLFGVEFRPDREEQVWIVLLARACGHPGLTDRIDGHDSFADGTYLHSSFGVFTSR